jgi:Protein of unknown function (DUF3102)
MSLFDQPAIVRDAADPALEQLAFEINSAHEAGERSARNGLDRFKEAGEALLKAKERLPHGEWLPWLGKNVKFSERTVRRYMALASGWEKIKSVIVADLTAALRLLAEDPDAKPKKGKKATPAQPFLKLCRPCRTYGAKAGCKECKKLNKPSEREAGDDTEAEQNAVERENPYAKKIDRYAESLSKIVSACFLRDIDPEDGKKLQADLQAVLEHLRRLAMAPIKEGVARPATCRDCGADILWVRSAKTGNNMPVDAEQSNRGTFNVVNGVAHHVKYEKGRDWRLYVSHLLSCRKRRKT